MNNLLLRLIDRSELGDSRIPGSLYFPPAPPEEQEARRILGVLPGDSPLGPLLVVRCIDAYSWLSARIPENSRSYDGMLGGYPLFSTSDLELLPLPNGTRASVKFSSGLPVHPTLTLEVSGDRLRIQRGNLRENVGYTEVAGVYTVPWPAWTGVTGLLEMPGSTGSITSRPYTLDYTGIRRAVSDSPAFTRILSETGLIEAFHRSEGPEMLGIAGVSVCEYNRDVRFQ